MLLEKAGGIYLTASWVIDSLKRVYCRICFPSDQIMNIFTVHNKHKMGFFELHIANTTVKKCAGILTV